MWALTQRVTGQLPDLRYVPLPETNILMILTASVETMLLFDTVSIHQCFLLKTCKTMRPMSSLTNSAKIFHETGRAVYDN